MPDERSPIANGATQIVSDPRGRFIYVAHTAVFTALGSVSGFSVNLATGALTPVPGSPFTAGMATGSLAIDSEGIVSLCDQQEFR